MSGANSHGEFKMKIADSFKRLVSVCVIALHLVVSTVLVVGPVHAQSGNNDGTPLIELELVESGTAGDTQVFSANITDNGNFLDVEFFYRFDSFADFRQIPMTVIPGTSFYTATVELTSRDVGVIEYYINVRDEDNNKVTKGFAFDPLSRLLIAPESPVLTAEPTVTPAATTPPAATGRSTGRTLLYVGLAVLAVGAIAAVASAGGDSSGGSPTTPGVGPTIPVTITVDTVASGF